MIIPDRKKAVSVILSKSLPDGKFEDELKPENNTQERSELLEGLAQDLMQGIKTGSARAVLTAFKALFEACEMEPQTQDSQENE